MLVLVMFDLTVSTVEKRLNENENITTFFFKLIHQQSERQNE